MLRFNANLFRLAYTCASNEETRYYLNGVFVEPHSLGGVTLTATDGRRLVVIRDENGFADECAIIKLPDLKACKQKHGQRVDVIVDGQDARIVEVTTDHEGNPVDSPIAADYKVRVDGSFPDYRRVIPQSFSRIGAPGFQGRYIGSFATLACELALHAGEKPKKHNTDDCMTTVQVLCDDGKDPEGSPALISFPHIDFAFGILMPVRVKKEHKPGLPAWFRAPAAPLAQAAE